MRVLVTGGSGFIGKHVCAELTRREHEPVTLDTSDWQSGEKWRGDVTEPDAWAAKQLEGVEAVIHLAGVLGTAELFDDPFKAVDVNVKGSLHALQFCNERGARYVAITMPDCWANVYQATKHCAARLATAWHKAFDVPVTHVRAFNVYGQGQKVGYPQKIIPTFSVAAYKGKPIPIWGDGSQFVDLISAEDTAKVLVGALGAPGKDETIEAGTKHGQTVMQVAHTVWGIARPGEPLITEFLPMRPGETSPSPFTARTVATGEGWRHLNTMGENTPQWNEAHFADVVRWYGEHHGT